MKNLQKQLFNFYSKEIAFRVNHECLQEKEFNHNLHIINFKGVDLITPANCSERAFTCIRSIVTELIKDDEITNTVFNLIKENNDMTFSLVTSLVASLLIGELEEYDNECGYTHIGVLEFPYRDEFEQTSLLNQVSIIRELLIG